jgi:hypothetical protein
MRWFSFLQHLQPDFEQSQTMIAHLAGTTLSYGICSTSEEMLDVDWTLSLSHMIEPNNIVCSMIII